MKTTFTSSPWHRMLLFYLSEDHPFENFTGKSGDRNPMIPGDVTTKKQQHDSPYT
jgi:hypothetical protein